MPKITDNSVYPQVTEVKENDILLGVQDGEVRQFPTNLVGGGGGEDWDALDYIDSSIDDIVGECEYFFQGKLTGTFRFTYNVQIAFENLGRLSTVFECNPSYSAGQYMKLPIYNTFPYSCSEQQYISFTYFPDADQTVFSVNSKAAQPNPQDIYVTLERLIEE